MCRVPTDNKIIHAPKLQSMKKSKMKCVYKRDSIYYIFSGEKEKTLKHASKLSMDKTNWCKTCMLEKVNNRSEGCYLCMNCGECEFFFFLS